MSDMLRILNTSVVSVFILIALFFSLPDLSYGAVRTNIIVEKANNERIALGYTPLVYSDTLERAAQLKAADMFANNYFNHDSPQGIKPWHWFKEAGYQYIYAGENLAVDFSDDNKIHTAWMKSPLHKANIINKNYTEIGIAVVQGVLDGQQTTLVVELFGTPKENTVVPRVPIAAEQKAINQTVNSVNHMVLSIREMEEYERLMTLLLTSMNRISKAK